MLTKEQIRNNREKMRKNMIGCLVTVQQNMPIMSLQLKSSKKQGKQVMQKTRKRRATEDSTHLQKSQFLPELYTRCSFDDLFELGNKIGEGSQSVVFSCLQLETKKAYAVKRMSVADTQRIETLKKQYKILRSINHPNIIEAKYLFINQCNQTVHLVCDHFNASDLRKYMKTKKTFDQSQAAEIINLILDAIIYLHKQGIAHRDIKPENILYNPQTKQLKLIDFQIAKKRSIGTKSISMLTNTGTLNYKAPQMFKAIYNEQIDVWAVGVILYEMVTGKLPFYSQYHKETIKLITSSEPNYPQTLSPICIDFLKRCLKRNPLERNTAFEAARSPFVLKNSFLNQMPSPIKKIFSTLEVLKKENIQEQDQNIKFFEQIEKSNDAHKKFNFKAGISQDCYIGIRCK